LIWKLLLLRETVIGLGEKLPYSTVIV
jgi:hypothetical protein